MSDKLVPVAPDSTKRPPVPFGTRITTAEKPTKILLKNKRIVKPGPVEKTLDSIAKEPSKSETVDSPKMASSIKLGSHDDSTLQNATVESKAAVSSPSNLAYQEADHANHLAKLCQEKSVDKLENGLQIGIQLLKELMPAVRDLNSPTGNHHLKTIESLLQADKPTRTVVGVVGVTGAGKSSTLNAVLNESQLLPTNCMRACTASVTELSFNYSTEPEKKYRAEVEFISPQDWATELELLWDDVVDPNGKISREATAKDGDASIAFHKVKAVYPGFEDNDLSACDPKTLAREPAVLQLLGTTKKIQTKTAAELVAQLRTYVDSKQERDGNVALMAAWPLVKVVRIYTKADALATGAVLVDLPGVLDSNAARAAVAAKYMKECSGLWVVAPISRAIDDKSAKTLMGNAFKQQLKFDGMFGEVTFICSKTDDISYDEAVESLELKETVQEKSDLIEKLQKQSHCAEEGLEQLSMQYETLNRNKTTKQRELNTWNRLSASFNRGLVVYPPPPEVTPKKRKNPTRQTRGRKSSAMGVIRDLPESEDELENDESIDIDIEPLTRTDIDQKIASLKEALVQLSQDKENVKKRHQVLAKKIKDTPKLETELRNEIAALCLKGRNDYSRKAIQQDFAAGIKEVDEEALVEQDESSFNPEVDFRDYAKVASSLPVFCVSSRAYQHLCGRKKLDTFNNLGFCCKEDTEIPQLVKHAQGMTETFKVGHCRRFMNDLLQIVESMTMWTTPREANMQNTDEEQRLIHDVLNRELETFKTAFATAIDTCVTALQGHFLDVVISALDAKIPTASSAAVDVCRAWGAPKSEGGMVWATFRATIKYMGSFHGKAGPRNFNHELLEPIMAPLASAWEETFRRRVPDTIKMLVASVQTALRTLHAQVTNANNLPVPTQDLAFLGRQLLRHSTKVSGIPDILNKDINEAQREANRQLEPAIVRGMQDGYRQALEEHGTGCYMRMKNIMASHVEGARHVMFEQAKKTVQDHLVALSDKIHGNLNDVATEINAMIVFDYSTALLGKRADRLNGIAGILASVDKRFAPAYEATPATVKTMKVTGSPAQQPIAEDVVPKTEH
ncbi:hypothetical protein MCOR25_007120 [Pyricularia grisea]|nr:hypothetical protein MCOR25_007120 [Pyricularia grisea]